MTLAQLRQAAALDADDQLDAQRMMAGKYALKAIQALEARDYAGATDYLIQASARRPEYAAALQVIGTARAGATKTGAKAASARANGRLGGRPRKQQVCS